MNNQLPRLVAEMPSTDVTVLRIATAAKNSVTQLYPIRPQIFLKGISELHRKVIHKLALHQIQDVTTTITLELERDRTINFAQWDDFANYDFATDSLTESLSIRWSFIFDADGSGEHHLHSILLKISESPTTAAFLQKMLSTRTDDLEAPEKHMFSAVFCKVDFADSRFSSEILGLATEWVNALPKAEPTFGFIKKLQKNGDAITTFIFNTLPPLAVLAYVGAWFAYIPSQFSNSTKYAAAWVLGGGALFLVMRYASILINNFLARQIRRIAVVPIFQVTSGDGNRMTQYMAKSQKSMAVLAGSALLYGVFKAIGLYLASLILTTPMAP